MADFPYFSVGWGDLVFIASADSANNTGNDYLTVSSRSSSKVPRSSRWCARLLGSLQSARLLVPAWISTVLVPWCLGESFFLLDLKSGSVQISTMAVQDRKIGCPQTFSGNSSWATYNRNSNFNWFGQIFLFLSDLLFWHVPAGKINWKLGFLQGLVRTYATLDLNTNYFIYLDTDPYVPLFWEGSDVSWIFDRCSRLTTSHGDFSGAIYAFFGCSKSPLIHWFEEQNVV